MPTYTASVTHPGMQDSAQPDQPFDYLEEVKVFDSLLADREQEAERTKSRREFRENRVNVQELRDRGEILNDETWIPDRTCDKNIRQQLASYIKFITQSPDVLHFKDIEIPTLDYTPLVNWLSDVFRIGDWKAPWFSLADCILTHGGGVAELMPRPDLPQQAEVDFVRRECLIIPAQTRALAACSRLGRMYEFTKSDFERLAKQYAWDLVAVQRVRDSQKSSHDFVRTYKWYMRTPSDGQLFVSWTLDRMYSFDSWLSMPTPLDGVVFDTQTDMLGQPVFTPRPEYDFPTFFFPFDISEDSTLLSIQGRVARDLHVQEAAEHVISSTVNGTIRASQFYPTRIPDPDGRTSTEPIGILKPGHVYPGQFSVFQSQWPSAVALSVLQALSVRNAADAGEVDFAAMSRQDTAKRATEINAAVSKAEELSSVSLELFSNNCLALYKRWLKLIVFAVQRGALNPPENIKQLLFRTQHPACLTSMAADITVVKKQQRVQRYLQYFPLVSGTPFANVYYEDMLMELFPEEFPKWKSAVGDTNNARQLLLNIQDAISKQDPNSLPEPTVQLFKNILDAISTVLQPAAVGDGF